MRLFDGLERGWIIWQGMVLVGDDLVVNLCRQEKS